VPEASSRKKHTLGQIFEIYLVNDAHGRGNHAKVLEGFLTPAEEFVALAIALELEFDVFKKCVGRAKAIDLDRMVDHQIDGYERIDFSGIAAQSMHGVAHGGQIDHCRHARKILEHYPGGLERHFHADGLMGVPKGQVFYVGFGDLVAVAIAEHGFEQDADGIGQGPQAHQTGVLQAGQTINAGRACAGVESISGVEGIEHGRVQGSGSGFRILGLGFGGCDYLFYVVFVIL